jgi:chromosome segregation ATPase
MNEPLSLEGDIRYLKAHLETKDRQLADGEARLSVYRTVIEDYTAQMGILRRENNFYHTRITELEDTCMRSTEHNRLLREEIALLNTHKKRYQEEILDLEANNEELFAALNNVRNIITRAADDIEGLIRVD